MKVDVLKKLIKESVKEAIQEELKEVLLEALKSNNKNSYRQSSNPSTVQPQFEVTNRTSTSHSSPSIETKVDLREKYNQALNETTLKFTSQDVPKFNPTTTADPINGTLPDGDVDLSQIMGLLKN